jgi:hypothetical protein
MGFADVYLQKAGLREALFEPEPHPGLHIIVTIPVYHESGLERCLDSLFICTCENFHAEVLILINAPSNAPTEVREHNLATLETIHIWIRKHSHPRMNFFVCLDHSFGAKEAGVGISRKILMDEAVRRFSMLERPEGIIASMDADAVVQNNYMEALVTHFQGESLTDTTSGAETSASNNPETGTRPETGTGPDGCSIRFEHPLSGSFHPSVYEAITQYELHLRYYLQSVRFTGYPYAYHTVGSSFAVRADIYCKEGGMNRRKGGEDFYFIQKVAQRGNFSQCNATCVIPSPRPSDRVPFGTGPVVSRLSAGKELLMTYDPRPFGILKSLFEFSGQPESLTRTWPEPLQSFLEDQGFKAALEEMKANSASAFAFRKRFWRWFNMFRIMKFLHFARELEYPDIPVGEAAAGLLKVLDPENRGIPSVGKDHRKLLHIYRMLDLR